MSVVMATLPITDLHTKQPEVLNGLQESPVVLTHRGRDAAVLVSPKQWNVQQVELRHLRLVAEAMRIKAKAEPTVPLEEVKRRLAANQSADNEGRNQ